LLKKGISAALVAVAFGVCATGAHAEIRTGQATDPSGDSLGGPGADIVSARTTYDTNGSLSVAVTTVGPPAGFFITLTGSVSGTDCLGVTGTLAGTAPGDLAIATITGIRGTGSALELITGNTVSFSTSAPAFAGKDWTCTKVAITDPGGNGQPLDELAAPIYFAGFEPDSDGDGVKDPSDKCPTVAAAGTADGCTPPPAPATTSKKPTSKKHKASKSKRCKAKKHHRKARCKR